MGTRVWRGGNPGVERWEPGCGGVGTGRDGEGMVTRERNGWEPG